MQTIPGQLIEAVKSGDEIPVTTQIIAEWNYNYFIPTTVTNAEPPTDSWLYNDLYFPLSSLTDGIRPKSGIFFAFTNESYTVGPYDQGIPSQRYYTVDKDNPFTYWITPSKSSEFNDNFDNSGVYKFNLANCVPVVQYSEPVRANKIRVTFNAGSLPIDWKISLKIGGVYQDIAVNPTINISTGVCELWFNGSTWSNIQNLDDEIYVSLTEIKVDIDSIDTANSRIQLLEIAAIRELDLSDRVVSYDTDMSMDEQSFIRPVGSINSNTGSLLVSNFDLSIKFNNTGNFAGLLNSWCQFRIYVDYDLSYWGGTSSNKIRIATLYTNEWRLQNESEYEIELFDIMKLLQLQKCPPVLIENQSFAAVMSRILDMVGCDTYKFQANDFDSTSKIKYFWTNGEESVYEVLKRLCESYFAAIFVDEYGVIQLLTKNQIANNQDNSVWDFLAENAGPNIADVISVKKNYETVSNLVTIKYKKREAKVDAQDLSNQPLTTKVWGSDDTIVLRATSISKSIPASGLTTGSENNSIWIDPIKAETWPYKAKVNIDGEVFEYYGKGYTVWNHSNNTKTEIVIKNDQDKRKYDLQTWNTVPGGGVNQDPSKQNGFTGRLYVTARALDESSANAHTHKLSSGWNMMNMWLDDGPGSGPYAGKYFEWGKALPVGVTPDWVNKTPWFKPQSKWSAIDSYLTCNNSDSPGDHHSAVALRKFDGNNNYMREFGTKIRFKPGWGHAGIVFNISENDDYEEDDQGPSNIINGTHAYMLNILTTETADKLGRAWTDEIFFEVKVDDTWYTMPTIRVPHEIRGSKWTVQPDKWYDLELVFSDDVIAWGVNASTVEVFIDGQYVDTFFTEYRIHPTPWAGLFVRGACTVDFDYFYATNTIPADFSEFDDELFGAYTVQLPAGSNISQIINIPRQNAWAGNVVVSFSSLTSANISSIKAIEDTSGDSSNIYAYRPGSGYVGPSLTPTALKIKDYGSLSLGAQRRGKIDLKYSGINPGEIVLTYTASNPISVTVETSNAAGYEYGSSYYNAPNDDSIWDIPKGGFLSNKLINGILKWNPSDNKAVDPLGNAYNRVIFFDEFGAVVHEIRDFDVVFDIAPVKGARVFLDNERCKVIDQKYHPLRGQFSIVNTSRNDEIVNGSQEISDTETIDHTLLMYGHVLENKGDEEKTVKNQNSILRLGEVKLDIDADWVFNEEDAESLAQWVIDHWSYPMDCYTIEVFANTFTQIGDKVSLTYTKLGIPNTQLFIVSEISRSFDSNAYQSSLTLRRIR